MKRLFSAAALVALAAAPALAQSSDVDTTLAALSAAQGDAYVQKRDEAIKALKPADLEAKLASATWTDKTFADLAMATIVLAHQKDADTVAVVNHLDGIDKAKYSKTRYGAPDVTRELRLLGPKASGALLELHLKTFEKYAFSADEVSNGLERLALRIGIVVQLARVKHPSALFVAKDIANDAKQLEGARNQAIGALGVIDSAESVAELARIHDAASTAASQKLATLRGAAWSSQAQAFALIAKDLEATDAATRRQAAVALGTFAAPGGWDSRGQRETGDAYRQQAAVKLVDALVNDRVPADVLVEQIGVVAHPAARPLLETAAANDKLTAAQRDTAKKALERLNLNIERNAKSR